MSARHADDQELCRQRTGMIIGKLCDNCEGRCPICDSRSNPSQPVKICDSCAGAERFSIFENNSSMNQQNNNNDSSNNNNAPIINNFGDHPAFMNNGLLQTSVSRNLSQEPSKNYVGNAGTVQSRCIICNGVGKHIAYYCRACCLLEKDRDGCPKVKTMGARKAMMERQKMMMRNKDQQQKQQQQNGGGVPGFS